MSLSECQISGSLRDAESGRPLPARHAAVRTSARQSARRSSPGDPSV